MTTIYFPDPGVRQRLYEGPLAICIDAFAEQLTRQGYASSTAREKLRLIAHLSRWLECNKLRTEDLNEACIARFRRYRRRQGRVDHHAAATCNALLGQLREAGVIPLAPDCSEHNVRRRIEADYTQYLAHERGLASATIINYAAVVRALLKRNRCRWMRCAPTISMCSFGGSRRGSAAAGCSWWLPHCVVLYVT
ncbi:MAG: hypothetical protein WD795_06000 [Woeseia sp.]